MRSAEDWIETAKGAAKIAAVVLAAFLAGLIVVYYRTGTIFPVLDDAAARSPIRQPR